MRKMIKIVVLLGALFLVYQFFIIFLVSNHEVRYSVKTDDNSYMIDEHYKKQGAYNMYYLKLTDKDDISFVASYNVGYNRQSQIVKDVKVYNDGNIYCIAPVLKDKKIEYISCRQGQNQVSVSYLHQIGNNSVNNFIDVLKSQEYKLYNELDIQNNIVKTEGNVSTYSNLMDNLYVSMWGYKGPYILNKNNIEYKIILENDMYFNTYAILCGRYYVILGLDGNTIGSYHVVNIRDGGKVTKDIDYTISKNVYINGIYNNKIYFTDTDSRVQYMINPASEKIKEVGSGSNALYYDGKNMQHVDIASLVNEKKYFAKNAISQDLISINGNYNYLESYGNYYYQEGNNIYQVLDSYKENKILLFTFDNFKELKVKNNYVFGISGDTVYMYNNETGLRKVATNRELIYNYSNIYDIYIG